MTAITARLSKKERLKNLGQIQYLFSESNKKVGKHPLLLLYTISPDYPSGVVKVLFSVSKKKFSRAVDRNRVKRLMRESYRNLPFKRLSTDKQMLLALVYTSKTIVTQEEVNKSLKSIYDVLAQRISESN
ncbi:MAG: ribonuclease P protein component [Bacteroidia bacterium]|jgi:ribonuclease P protein component